MSDYVTITVEATFEINSEEYKKAVEMSDKFKDLGLSMFQSPEDVLKNCLTLGSNHHISRNMDYLSAEAENFKAKRNGRGNQNGVRFSSEL